MQITCIICSDLLGNSAEIFTTKCGHIFHHHCLIQWLERSKTCPQCRVKNSESNIHRVYFNFASNEGVEEDKATLVFKMDNMQFNMKLKDLDIKNWTEKAEKAEAKAKGLVSEVRKAEREVKEKESAIFAYKEQLGFYKNRTKDMQKLSEELEKCKIKLRSVEDLQSVINGSEEEAKDTLKYNRDPESLALMITTIKKQMIDLDRHKKKLQTSLRHRDEELHVAKREIKRLNEENSKLRLDIECHKSCESEKQYLKSQIRRSADLNLSENSRESSSTARNRIIFESPAPMPKKTDTNTHTPPILDRVKQALESDSPYLPVKSTSFVGSGIYGKSGITSAIIKKPSLKISSSFVYKPSDVTRKPRTDVVYDGMGGHFKVDEFPSPTKNDMKRTKSTISSNKFRKLAPHKTLHDYVRKNDT